MYKPHAYRLHTVEQPGDRRLLDEALGNGLLIKNSFNEIDAKKGIHRAKGYKIDKLSGVWDQ